MCQVTGANDEIPLLDPLATSPLLKLPVEIWAIIFSYLQEPESTALRQAYSRMEYIHNTFRINDTAKKFIPLREDTIDLRGLKRFRSQLNQQARRSYSRLDWNNAWKNYLCPPRSVCQPKGLNVKLYTYQAQALSWYVYFSSY